MKPYNRDKTTKSEEVREMFDSIAPAYDSLNHILSMQIDKLWRRRVVKLAKREEPATLLDLATGTGDLAIALSRALPETRITAIDPSEGMLEVARTKLERLKLQGRISLAVGSAEALDIESGAMDMVTVAFGVRNFGDLEGGLKEIARVLRGGGRVIILEFSTPKNRLLGSIYGLYSRHILPFIGGLLSRDRRAYEYLPASVDEFPAPEHFAAMMVAAGFSAPELRALSGGIAYIYSAEKR